jgi:hypothetical protein
LKAKITATSSGKRPFLSFDGFPGYGEFIDGYSTLDAAFQFRIAEK